MSVDLTVVSCSYGNPWLLKNFISSVNRFYNIEDILICENTYEGEELSENLSYMDGLGVRYILNGGRSSGNFHDHASGVRLLLESVETKYILLLDTDIELRMGISNLLNLMEDNNVIACGYIGDRCFTQMRIYPWFMVMDVGCVLGNGIYFNEEEVHLSTGNRDLSGGRKCDTGSLFYSQCMEKGLKVLSINKLCKSYNDTPWYKHYEGLSWSELLSEGHIFKDRQLINSKLKEKWS